MNNSSETSSELTQELARLRQEVQELKREALENQYYEHILSHIAEGVYIIRVSDGVIVYTNPAFERMFGYPPGGLLDQPVSILNSPRHSDPESIADQIIKILREREVWRGEILNITRDGTDFWSYVSVKRTTHPEYGEVWLAAHTNIDQRKRSEVARRQSEALYRSLVDTLPYSVYRIDLEGRFTFANQMLLNLFGVNEDEIIGQVAYDFSPPPLVEKYRSDNAYVFETGEIFHDMEVNEHPKTGEKIYVRVSKVPIYDVNNNICGLQGIFEDVTEHINTENQLFTSQNILEHLIQEMPVGLQIFDTNGTCTNVNATHLRIFGVERNDLIDKYNILTDPLAERMGNADAARRALQGETVVMEDVEFNFTQADPRFADVQQQQRYLHVTIFPLFDHRQQVTSIVGLNVDVTNRRLAENALRLSEARYRAVVEDQPEMLARYQPGGSLTFINSAFCRFMGRTSTQLLGTRWQTLLDDGALKLAVDTMERLSYEKPHSYFEAQLSNTQGSLRWIQWNIRALFDEHQRIVEYQAVGIDITEKKRQDKQQFEGALEQERINILSDFVIKASHEFRTPLSIITSLSYIMARIEDADTRMERHHKIARQVTRITRLIDSMILMSRLDRGLIEPESQLADINQLLHIVYIKFKEQFQQENRVFSLQLHEKAMIIAINEKDFIHALSMICDNAFQHTRPDDTITIRSIQEGEWAQVEVMDSGKGMKSDTLPHIFERFYREDTTGKTPGIGLGLPIAKAILRQYGATIEADSKLDEGTAITIRVKIISGAIR
ncbi:MAG: PAS domain-containing sensor histidine kinase [Anaerolineae bacterium]